MLKTFINYFINLFFLVFFLAFSDYLCFYRVNNNDDDNNNNNNNTIYKIFIICLNNFIAFILIKHSFIHCSFFLLFVFSDNLSL